MLSRASAPRPPGTALVRAALTLWPAALALLVVGPALGSGHLLLRDAVSTPRSYLTDAALGVSDAAPRAVPQDVFVSVASSVVDGGTVVIVVLVLALWAAGAGASAMVGCLIPEHGPRSRAAGVAGRLVASTLAVWNPYVAERLLQGHWSLLVGYAALPWLVWAGVRMRSGAVCTGSGATLVALACAGLTPTGAVLGLLAALPVAALSGGWRRSLRVVVVVATFLAVSAPWLVAAAVSGGSGTATSDPAGVDAFAARAEAGLGTIGSLAGLGGIWNAQAIPSSRIGFGAAAGTAALLVLVACGVRGVWRRRANPVIATVAVLTVAAIVLPALGATGPGLATGRWLVVHIAGAGLFRDGQKWVALAMPGYALAAALGAQAIGSWVTRTATSRTNRTARGPAVGGIVGVVLLIAALPSLAWGVGGALRPVHYPPAWDRVAAIVDDAPPDGAIAVLPPGSFRAFPWTHGPVLDPAPRHFRPEVLTDGDLIVSGETVAGEDTRAEDVTATLLAGAGPGRLADEGVRWVLVEHRTPGEMGDSAAALAQLERKYSDDALSLYRVPGAVQSVGASGSARAWSWTGHGIWFGAGISGAALLAIGLFRQGPRARRMRGNRGVRAFLRAE